MKSSVVYRPYVDAEVNLIENFTALPTNLIDLVRDSAIGIVFSARYDGQSLTAVQTGAAIAGTIGLAILIARLVYRRDARLFYFGYPLPLHHHVRGDWPARGVVLAIICNYCVASYILRCDYARLLFAADARARLATLCRLGSGFRDVCREQ